MTAENTAQLPTNPTVVTVVEKSLSLKLFGLGNLQYRFFEYSNDPSEAEVTLEEWNLKTVTQVVVLTDVLRLSTFFPEFSGTPFDQVTLSNVVFIRQVSSYY